LHAKNTSSFTTFFCAKSDVPATSSGTTFQNDNTRSELSGRRLFSSFTQNIEQLSGIPKKTNFINADWLELIAVWLSETHLLLYKELFQNEYNKKGTWYNGKIMGFSSQEGGLERPIGCGFKPPYSQFHFAFTNQIKIIQTINSFIT
jgi:hypothetical protein